ncbi:hypothetical protein PV11_03027 [Exophiala sideris]|uniref:DUF302 domain-containing protein n=1 Tax=Exophiala sideris TaxID=1016849 RepID=A0A0D1Z0Z0_9EURO|nr:hypothetical protein PV11_03027 [Exophiala sideris]
MPLTTQTQHITLDRLIYHSPTSFEIAESRLRSSIQNNHKGSQSEDRTFQQTASTPSPATHPTDKTSFEASIAPKLGPHGFMYFTEFNHGNWLQFYTPPTSAVTDTPSGTTKNLRAIRYVLGNPLVAITMLRHDLDAGLSVPVELYLVEEPEGGVKIIWFRPSGLVAGYEGANSELVDAARVLDAKLERFVRYVLDEEDEGSGGGKL